MRTKTAIACMMLSLAACKHTIPEHSATPPEFKPETIQPKSSVLTVPVTFSLSRPVQDALNKLPPVNAQFLFKDNVYDVRLDVFRQLCIWNKCIPIPNNPNAQITNGALVLTAEYQGDVEGHLCHLRPFRPIATVSVPFIVSPIGDHFQYGPGTVDVTAALAPDSDTKCGGIPFLSQDIRDKANTALREKASSFLDVSKLGDLTSKSVSLEPFTSSRVIPVKGLTQSLCWTQELTEIRYTPVAGKLELAAVTLQTRGFHRVVLAKDCPKSDNKNVVLKKVDAVLSNEPSAFNVSFSVGYDLLSNQLLQGVPEKDGVRQLSVGGFDITIKKVTAKPSAGRVLAGVDVTGDLDGTLYFWGTPTLSKDGSAMSLPDLQMAVETRTALDAIKVGLAQLIEPDADQKLRDAAYVDLTPKIKQLKDAVAGDQTSDKFTLHVQLTGRVVPQSIVAGPAAVTAYVAFEGVALSGSVAP